MSTAYHSRLASLRQHLADFVYPEGVERRQQAEREANFDALTDLANARALARALPSAEADPTVSIIVFDANNFGLINKRAGHTAGDHTLKLIARSVERSAHRFGFAARCFRKGGDEFVVIAPTSLAEAIRDEAELDFGVITFEGFTVSLSGTIGTTFDAADVALQARKDARKNG